MHLKDSKIIVIKIGSSLLVNDKKKIRKKWLSSFAKDIHKLKSRNKKVIRLNNYKSIYKIKEFKILITLHFFIKQTNSYILDSQI